jgi:long-chain acyl-CoA synthetase
MEIKRTFDILENYRTNFRKHDALNCKVNGKWINYSSDEYIEKSTFFAYGLLALGLKKGDRIVSVTNNRPEWNIADMGMSMAGMIHVPVYPTISNEDYGYILEHCEPSIVLVSDKILLEKIRDVRDGSKSNPRVYTFNQLEGEYHWFEIIEGGKTTREKFKTELEEIKGSIQPDDMVTLIYTSGTTGFPKGVMLSHRNILDNARAASNIHNFDSSHRTLSFLPLCHVFERMVNYHFQSIGVGIYYAENLGTIAENLKEVQPHVFISVPRLIERVYDKIIGAGKDLPYLKKRIFFWSVNVGLNYEYVDSKSFFYKLKLRIANKLVFKKWREALGNNIQLIIVGGAALQPRLSRVFGAAGIPVLEGYGLTETSPVIAANNIITGEIKIGTVGAPFEGVEVKIAKDGEILCRGSNVMLGYYKEPKLTSEVIDKDGWFHTGDIGVMVDNKYVKITDRKKEMFKLSSGKYIAPQVIENKFKESFFIEQLMVIGENQKFASAIISPNFPFLHNWASIHKIKFRDNHELIRDPAVIERFQQEVNEMNKKLGQTEHIKRFRLVAEEWGPQTGELSPTLKLKRKVLYEKYTDTISAIFKLENNGNN